MDQPAYFYIRENIYLECYTRGNRLDYFQAYIRCSLSFFFLDICQKIKRANETLMIFVCVAYALRSVLMLKNGTSKKDIN